ncbi:MAG: hypothetical protein DME99_06225 [Verrucomicrobia bacterium]|nr:MAG: hypothetical protein DME99_06225 [Verrucomicrobiota bacterium]
MSSLARADLGSVRVSRAGFGVTPKQSLRYRHAPNCERQKKARDREDALANTRDAYAPQT